MQIPQSQGQVIPNKFVVYTACDTDYFDQFAKIFCISVLTAAESPVHLHIYNPRGDQLDWCRANNVGVTWEYVEPTLFEKATANLLAQGGEGLRRSQVAMTKGNDTDVNHRIIKTYYACARFIRLAAVHQQCPTVFACDVDAVVRKPIPTLSDKDFYIHQIFGPKARFLAGGLYLNHGASNFINLYSDVLEEKIKSDALYWSVDQDVLDPLVPQFNYGQLPNSLIDWNMRPDSVVWTAKGARKNNGSFVTEQQKYAV